MAIFTLTSPLSNEYLINALSSILDGIIEMKIEDHDGSLTRSIRLLFQLRVCTQNPLGSISRLLMMVTCRLSTNRLW